MERKFPNRIEIIVKNGRLIRFNPKYLDRNEVEGDFAFSPYKIYSKFGPCYRKLDREINTNIGTKLFYVIDYNGIQDG